MLHRLLACSGRSQPDTPQLCRVSREGVGSACRTVPWHGRIGRNLPPRSVWAQASLPTGVMVRDRPGSSQRAGCAVDGDDVDVGERFGLVGIVSEGAGAPARTRTHRPHRHQHAPGWDPLEGGQRAQSDRSARPEMSASHAWTVVQTSSGRARAISPSKPVETSVLRRVCARRRGSEDPSSTQARMISSPVRSPSNAPQGSDHLWVTLSQRAESAIPSRPEPDEHALNLPGPIGFDTDVDANAVSLAQRRGPSTEG